MDINIRLFLPDEVDIYNFSEAIGTSIQGVSNPFEVISRSITRQISELIKYPTMFASTCYSFLFIKSIIDIYYTGSISSVLGMFGHGLGICFCIVLLVIINKDKNIKEQEKEKENNAS